MKMKKSVKNAILVIIWVDTPTTQSFQSVPGLIELVGGWVVAEIGSEDPPVLWYNLVHILRNLLEGGSHQITGWGEGVQGTLKMYYVVFKQSLILSLQFWQIGEKKSLGI
jgi:hypothetical protein